MDISLVHIANVQKPSHSQSLRNPYADASGAPNWVRWLVYVLNNLCIQQPYYANGSYSLSCTLCLCMLRCNSDSHIEIWIGTVWALDPTPCSLSPLHQHFSHSVAAPAPPPPPTFVAILKSAAHKGLAARFHEFFPYRSNLWRPGIQFMTNVRL